VAGLLAGIIAVALCKNRSVNNFAEISFDGYQGLYTEFLWTFLLVSVVLNTAASCSPGYKNNSFFGLAIAFTVVSGVIAVGDFSGAAFNPAVVTALNFAKIGIDGYHFNLSDIILAIVFEMTGGLLAVIVFMVTESVESVESQTTESSKGIDKAWEMRVKAVEYKPIICSY